MQHQNNDLNRHIDFFPPFTEFATFQLITINKDNKQTKLFRIKESINQRMCGDSIKICIYMYMYTLENPWRCIAHKFAVMLI